MDNDQMKNQNVDADKILNHLKYTRHWLDKADDDYRHQRFGPGGMVIGLARAELTAAWEEALQLKTQVVRKMPRQARQMASWKNASVVGLMASGFLIAFMVIKFSGNPDFLTPRDEPVLRPQAVIVTEEQAPEARETAPAAAEIVDNEQRPTASAAIDTEAATAVDTATPAARPAPARRESRRESRSAPRARTAPAPAHAPAAVTPEPVPERVIIIHEPAPQPAAKPDRLDDIDLYKIANDAIMD